MPSQQGGDGRLRQAGVAAAAADARMESWREEKISCCVLPTRRCTLCCCILCILFTPDPTLNIRMFHSMYPSTQRGKGRQECIAPRSSLVNTAVIVENGKLSKCCSSTTAVAVRFSACAKLSHMHETADHTRRNHSHASGVALMHLHSSSSGTRESEVNRAIGAFAAAATTSCNTSKFWTGQTSSESFCRIHIRTPRAYLCSPRAKVKTFC